VKSTAFPPTQQPASFGWPVIRLCDYDDRRFDCKTSRPAGFVSYAVVGELMATGLESEKRLFLARLAEARDNAEGGPRRRLLKRTAAALVIVAMLALLVVWISGFFSTPKELLEIRTMVNKEIVQLQKVARNEAPLTYNDTGFRQNWERMRDMPPEVREQARKEMERLFQAREQAEQRSYFAMPPKQRQQELDRRIKAEQARRQQRGNRNRGSGGNGGQGGQGNNASGGQGRGGAAQANAAGSARSAGGGQNGGGGGRPSATRGGSDEARTARSKRRIDSTDPDERAQNAEYRRLMDLRRQQLGITPGRGR